MGIKTNSANTLIRYYSKAMAKFPIKFSKKRQKYYIDHIDYNSESFDSIEDAKKRVKDIKEYLKNQSPYDDGTNGALSYYGGYF